MSPFAAALALCLLAHGAAAQEAAMPDVKLIPYPQHIAPLPGRLRVGPARYETASSSRAIAIAQKSLDAYLPKSGEPVRVRLGSLEERCGPEWLPAEERAWLGTEGTSPEASVVRVEPGGITIVGKGRWGMLYGVQTVNQMLGNPHNRGRRGTQRDPEKGSPLSSSASSVVSSSPPVLASVVIRDWPDMKWRCLSPQMTWYSGYNRLEGYDCGNWTLDEWKWLVDWSLLHKCNGWALCMYGNWPFTLPGYEETTLDVASFRYNPQTGRKEPWRFVHRNIRREFLPELIRYANERGIRIYAYIGKNSFNGTYGLKHPDANAGGAAELIPFHPGVHEYWEAAVRRLLEVGFDGFVFEDPEALHVPNHNAECYRTFWEPWAKTYGFSSVAETDANKPPLGVHVEYYTWLLRTFDDLIRKHAAALGRPDPEVYLISHILLSRMVGESKTQAERDRWFALIDEKQGRKVPFVILEADEAKYVSFLGGERVASLGGRGGSCTNAMRRTASINNNWTGGGMGGDLAYERQCQKRIFEAGGFGAMGYIFEWTNTEVFGYLAAQYLWRSAGVPGIDNESQTGFLDYAYRMYYGDTVGRLVARVMDEGSCVNDAMMLEGVYGSQYPETGAPLHRDYQYLAVLADRAVDLAGKAYRAYTGHPPDLTHAAYPQDAFRWNGFDARADRLFKAERLRLLYVSTVRSKHMCGAVMAHRKAQRVMAEGAPAGEVLAEYDRSISEARTSERIYQANFDDDYDWTDGLCSRVTEALEGERRWFVASVGSGVKPLREWAFAGGTGGWTQVHDAAPTLVEGGALVARAAGPDPFVVLEDALQVPVGKRTFIEIRMACDRPGRLRLFWATAADLARQPADAYPFSESRVRNGEVAAGNAMATYHISPDWEGTLSRLRLDLPAGATARIAGIRIADVPEGLRLTPAEFARPVPDAVRSAARKPLHIPWERVSDLVPARSEAGKPGLYLSTSLARDQRADFFCLGVVFSVEVQDAKGNWVTLFRRSVDRRETAWQHWDIPLGDHARAGALKVRFVTDSYSRAQNRALPSWKWALWGRPELVDVASDGTRRVLYDFAANAGQAAARVRLDADGRERAFSSPGEDSTGAAFRLSEPGPITRLRAAELKGRQWVRGFASWIAPPAHRGGYRCYLGDVTSGWAYRDGGQELSWVTDPVPARAATAVALIGGSGYAPGKGELWCDGRRLLSFDMAVPEDRRWSEGGVELRYLHGGDTRSPTITYGISGVYVLLLPPDRVTPGRPLRLQVKLPARAGDWFMVHEYPDPELASSAAACPRPAMPTIAAFTPHREGQFGVTIGEYQVKLER